MALGRWRQNHRGNKLIRFAEKFNKILQPVHQAMFVESNPSPVKYAAKLTPYFESFVLKWK